MVFPFPSCSQIAKQTYNKTTTSYYYHAFKFKSTKHLNIYILKGPCSKKTFKSSWLRVSKPMLKLEKISAPSITRGDICKKKEKNQQ